MRTRAEIAWLAGLVEGEGWFTRGTGRHTSITLGIGMTDLDVIQKAQNLLGIKTKVHAEIRPPAKTMYRLVCSGPLSAGWAMTLYTLLGSRRRAKIRECLVHWRARKGRGSTIHLARAKRWPPRKELECPR